MVHLIYMEKYIFNLEKETLDNNYFRKVLLTTTNQQLVVMSLEPKEDIGQEIHSLDQFIKVEAGLGTAILNGLEISLSSGFSITIPKGTTHNIINTSLTEKLKLYSIYSPPNHKDGVIHQTKEEALRDEFNIPEITSTSFSDLNF